MMEDQSRIKNVEYITSGEHCDRTWVIHARSQYSGGQALVWSFDIEEEIDE